MKSNVEQLERDPALAILPSGDALSLRNIQAATYYEYPVLVLDYGPDARDQFIFDREDIAAIRAALNYTGVQINAPTLAGEDRDGDGNVGER